MKLTYEALKQNIKDKKIEKLYIFLGYEVYLKEYCLNLIKKALNVVDSSDFNYFYTDSKDFEAKDLADVVNTIPFMADRKLVILKDTNIFSKDKDKLSDIFLNLPGYICLIICEREADRRLSAYKAAEKEGYVVEFVTPKESDLYAWASNIITKAKKRISREDLYYFIRNTELDMTSMREELIKLISYCDEKEIITRKDIDDVIIKPLSEQTFVMIEALFEKNTRVIFSCLYEMKELRVPAMKILSTLFTQFSDILKAKILLSEGKSDGEIVEKIKRTSDYAAKKALSYAKKSSGEFLRRAIFLLKKADGDIKAGISGDFLALEMTLFRLMKI